MPPQIKPDRPGGGLRSGPNVNPEDLIIRKEKILQRIDGLRFLSGLQAGMGALSNRRERESSASKPMKLIFADRRRL